MKVGDIVKSLPIRFTHSMGYETEAIMTGMIIRQTTASLDDRLRSATTLDDWTQGTEWLVHWFEYPPDELTFEYSEDLEVISESKENIRR